MKECIREIGFDEEYTRLSPNKQNDKAIRYEGYKKLSGKGIMLKRLYIRHPKINSKTADLIHKNRTQHIPKNAGSQESDSSEARRSNRNTRPRKDSGTYLA